MRLATIEPTALSTTLVGGFPKMTASQFTEPLRQTNICAKYGYVQISTSVSHCLGDPASTNRASSAYVDIVQAPGRR